MGQSIVLYDGVCNLCNGVVAFTLRRNRKASLKYAALQSDAGRAILRRCGLESIPTDTFIFVENGKPYVKSTAALRLAKHLDGGWRFAYCFIIIPRFVRDSVYTFVAKNRYRWFGRREACLLMRPEYRERFLN
ncbi:thiol-disulfide oxidoreductase DCC family protein [Paenibacillus alkalitolerans]|uniref:thiol-disulfide oxidoreductase DCC family protein n=1 Tax=Paenibacillus alkalitolerans TaxID=2799335 RepID=UPI0018F5614F|nr:thiol-disulfide oxidoreductase DCC family protein [Paenibacillus alkalitolerans]